MSVLNNEDRTHLGRMVVNLLDESERLGLELHLGELGRTLGVPVVGAALVHGRGLQELQDGVEERDQADAGHLCIANGPHGLRIVDVRDPAAPRGLGHLLLGESVDELAQDIVAMGRTVYVAAAFAGVHVVDVTDPANPTLVETFDTSTRR